MPGWWSATGHLQRVIQASTRATELFDVTLSPLALADANAGALLGRMRIDKALSGDLTGTRTRTRTGTRTGTGEMLTAGGAVKGCAGYVAIERVSGAPDGHGGSLVL